MEIKIKKWSKRLKWLLAWALLFYAIGLSTSLPDFLASENWTTATATQDIIEQLNGYIDMDTSTVHLLPDAPTYHLQQKSYYLYGRLAEILFNLILFTLGFLVTRKLSQEVVFDDFICRLTRLGGIIICISSIVIPSLSRTNAFLTLLGGFFSFDIVVDGYRLGCGMAVILLAYLLRQGQFLQEEYDTTL